MSNEPNTLGVQRIVSGGQTGVDRGALDAAIDLSLEHGGWCPRGRLAEDGVIPPQYELKETLSAKYSLRTEQNVIDSDATLILHVGGISAGTDLTRRMAEKHRKPCLAAKLSDLAALEKARHWIIKNDVKRLNVAGPRESSSPGICLAARDFVRALLGS